MATLPNAWLTVQAVPISGGQPQVSFMGSSPPFTPQALGAPLPAPAATENSGASTVYRFYDRAAKVGNPGNGNTLYAYQNDRIFGFTGPPNWSLVHSITGQHTALGFGGHTGLYLVDASDGSVVFLVGLFQALAGGFGFVKLNLSTGVWTDGTATGLSGAGTPGGMGVCVTYKGRLVHAHSNFLTLFDPLTDSFTQAAMPFTFADQYAKLKVARGRLFVVNATAGGRVQVGEFIFGGVAVQATLPTDMLLASQECFVHQGLGADFNQLFVGYEQDGAEPSGQGHVLFQYAISTSAPGAPLPAPFDATGIVEQGEMVPPLPFSNAGSEINVWGDNGHTAIAGQQSSVLGYRFNFRSLTNLWDVFGAQGILITSPWTLQFGGNQPHGEYSRFQSPNGTSEHLAPNGFPQIESFTRFSDGTVARGILIKFRMYTAGGSFPQLRFLFGGGLNPVGGVQATLSVGDGIVIGGTMTLDAPLKFLNTGGPVQNGTTQFQIIWDLDADGIAADEWILIRPTGFTLGLELPGFMFPGPAHSVFTIDALTAIGSPPETGGPVRETNPITSGSPPQTGGPVRVTATLTSGSPPAT
ncbi:hypothetical protein LCGC14_1695710, partial [marine sediment metagenome]